MASNSIGNGSSSSFDSSTYNKLINGAYGGSSPADSYHKLFKGHHIKGYGDTSKTNIANLAMTRETNAFNYMLAAQQNDWNVEQWNRENEYNSASAQRQRLLDAGLNPNLMLDGGSAGTASSLQSADYANAVAPQLQSPASEKLGYIQQILGVVQNAAQNYMGMQQSNAQVANLNAQTDAQNIQNTFLARLLEAQATKSESEAKGYKKWYEPLMKEQYASQWLSNDLQGKLGLKTQNLQNRLTAQSISNMMTEQAFTSANTNLLQKKYDWFDTQTLYELYESSTRAQLNGANAYHAMQSAYNVAEQTRGLKLDNNMKEKLFDDTYKASRAQLQYDFGKYGSNPYGFGILQNDVQTLDAQYDKDHYYTRGSTRAHGNGIMGSGASIPSIGSWLNDAIFSW